MNDAQGRNKNGPGPSRREFLKGSGAAAAATALATAPVALAVEEAADSGKVAGMGPAAVTVQLNVNGKKMSQALEPRVTLLDALRNYLDVTGCKRVCDRGTCGACTVMLDGKPVYSCTMFAVEAQGRQIKTAEALVADGVERHDTETHQGADDVPGDSIWQQLRHGDPSFLRPRLNRRMAWCSAGAAGSPSSM